MQLTGRTRHRVKRTWFGREYLVLQVEETGIRSYSLGGAIDCESYTEWRDATTEDLTVVEPPKAKTMKDINFDM